MKCQLLILIFCLCSNPAIALSCAFNKDNFPIVNNKQVEQINKVINKAQLNYLHPKSWSIPFYDRDLNNSSFSEILCITSRDAKNRIRFGHTAISRFRLEQVNGGKKKLQARQIETIGFWPFREIDKKDPKKGLVNLLTNSPKDHFLKFEHSFDNRQNVSLCVPINNSESNKLNQFFKEHEYSRWDLAYNCNDLSGEAFKLATGITLNSRTISSFNISTPETMGNSIRKLLETMKKPKYFLYKPKGSTEVQKLIELEHIGNLSVATFESR